MEIQRQTTMGKRKGKNNTGTLPQPSPPLSNSIKETDVYKGIEKVFKFLTVRSDDEILDSMGLTVIMRTAIENEDNGKEVMKKIFDISRLIEINSKVELSCLQSFEALKAKFEKHLYTMTRKDKPFVNAGEFLEDFNMFTNSRFEILNAFYASHYVHVTASDLLSSLPVILYDNVERDEMDSVSPLKEFLKRVDEFERMMTKLPDHKTLKGAEFYESMYYKTFGSVPESLIITMTGTDVPEENNDKCQTIVQGFLDKYNKEDKINIKDFRLPKKRERLFQRLDEHSKKDSSQETMTALADQESMKKTLAFCTGMERVIEDHYTVKRDGNQVEINIHREDDPDFKGILNSILKFVRGWEEKEEQEIAGGGTDKNSSEPTSTKTENGTIFSVLKHDGNKRADYNQLAHYMLLMDYNANVHSDVFTKSCCFLTAMCSIVMCILVTSHPTSAAIISQVKENNRMWYSNLAGGAGQVVAVLLPLIATSNPLAWGVGAIAGLLLKGYEKEKKQTEQTAHEIDPNANEDNPDKIKELERNKKGTEKKINVTTRVGQTLNLGTKAISVAYKVFKPFSVVKIVIPQIASIFTGSITNIFCNTLILQMYATGSQNGDKSVNYAQTAADSYKGLTKVAFQDAAREGDTDIIFFADAFVAKMKNISISMLKDPNIRKALHMKPLEEAAKLYEILDASLSLNALGILTSGGTTIARSLLNREEFISKMTEELTRFASNTTRMVNSLTNPLKMLFGNNDKLFGMASNAAGNVVDEHVDWVQWILSFIWRSTNCIVTYCGHGYQTTIYSLCLFLLRNDTCMSILTLRDTMPFFPTMFSASACIIAQSALYSFLAVKDGMNSRMFEHSVVTTVLGAFFSGLGMNFSQFSYVENDLYAPGTFTEIFVYSVNLIKKLYRGGLQARDCARQIGKLILLITIRMTAIFLMSCVAGYIIEPVLSFKTMSVSTNDISYEDLTQSVLSTLMISLPRVKLALGFKALFGYYSFVAIFGNGDIISHKISKSLEFVKPNLGMTASNVAFTLGGNNISKEAVKFGVNAIKWYQVLKEMDTTHKTTTNFRETRMSIAIMDQTVNSIVKLDTTTFEISPENYQLYLGGGTHEKNDNLYKMYRSIHMKVTLRTGVMGALLVKTYTVNGVATNIYRPFIQTFHRTVGISLVEENKKHELVQFLAGIYSTRLVSDNPNAGDIASGDIYKISKEVADNSVFKPFSSKDHNGPNMNYMEDEIDTMLQKQDDYTQLSDNDTKRKILIKREYVEITSLKKTHEQLMGGVCKLNVFQGVAVSDLKSGIYVVCFTCIEE